MVSSRLRSHASQRFAEHPLVVLLVGIEEDRRVIQQARPFGDLGANVGKEMLADEVVARTRTLAQAISNPRLGLVGSTALRMRRSNSVVSGHCFDCGFVLSVHASGDGLQRSTQLIKNSLEFSRTG